MTGAELALTLSSCIAFMALVALIAWRQARGSVDTKDGYFLAGRGLGGVFIAGSLLLTNLSAEQLIGLNGSAYGFNLSSMAWEVTAATATIAMAFIFLPRYLAGAFTTLPEFLRDRYDIGVQRLSVVLFLLGYGLVTIPSVLYSGSIAVMKIFDVPALFGIGEFPALVATILVIGVIGATYAVFGGLKAVAVSDTVNGIGLLFMGVLILVLGLMALGGGDIAGGVQRLVQENPEKLNAIGGADDPTPFGTIFTGMIIANLFYWCTNQYVIQRTLAARSLAEGQKGVLLSGYFKVLVPFLMMVPGVIAFHLYGPGLSTIDLAYPQLVKDLLPHWLMGLFLAVLLGAVFSSFNSLVNSAATLFCLDILAPMRKTPLSDRAMVRTAKLVSAVIALFSFVVAPLLFLAPEGLWQIIRIFTGFYNIPVITIVLVGLFTRRVPAIGAKIVIVFHVIAYGLLKFALADVVTLHFLHIYAVLFVIEVTIMLACGRIAPRAEAWHFTPVKGVDLTRWRWAVPTAVTLFSCVVATYLLFSNFGLASGGVSAAFAAAMAGLTILNLAFWYGYSRRSVA
ncbi:solute:sodium symporter family transporter [Altererythrobacter sp. ZODW24]|uniref:solute:sodium symporter family transporter n=1 Tax=Altererythrobacter sp. ZODW24 TaxID=2185142 RepID=UPI000DF838F4|nr:solute:sodium symporter family transporter [Altererythrobacter sp. ZODW24]